MDREDLRDEVRSNIKRTTDGVANTRINTWLNWAQGYLADLHTYEEMHSNDTSKTCTESSVVVAWPTRMKDLYSVTVQDGSRSRKLIYVHPRDFDRVVPRPATYTEGLPNWYVDYASTFEVFNIPDDDYDLVIRCSVYPIDFADDDAESTLLRKDALLCAMATVFGFWSLREIEDATYWGQTVVPPLYNASLTSDHSSEDWVPIARGFTAQPSTLTGEWWKSPFAGRSVPGL